MKVGLDAEKECSGLMGYTFEEASMAVVKYSWKTSVWRKAKVKEWFIFN